MSKNINNMSGEAQADELLGVLEYWLLAWDSNDVTTSLENVCKGVKNLGIENPEVQETLDETLKTVETFFDITQDVSPEVLKEKSDECRDILYNAVEGETAHEAPSAESGPTIIERIKAILESIKAFVLKMIEKIKDWISSREPTQGNTDTQLENVNNEQVQVNQTTAQETTNLKHTSTKSFAELPGSDAGTGPAAAATEAAAAAKANSSEAAAAAKANSESGLFPELLGSETPKEPGRKSDAAKEKRKAEHMKVNKDKKQHRLKAKKVKTPANSNPGKVAEFFDSGDEKILNLPNAPKTESWTQKVSEKSENSSERSK